MASSFISVACQANRIPPALCSIDTVSNPRSHLESTQIAFTSLSLKSSRSRNVSRLRKIVHSIRVLKRRSRPQSVEAALASSGVESSGDAATSNRGHEFLQVRGVKYRPPGTEINLLNDVSLSLSEKSLGLVYGRSGSGKTTFLQVLAGLAAPTEGSIILGDSTHRSLSSKAGIVFQFPERYFVADTVLEELTFGWPRRMEDMLMRQQLAMRLQAAVFAVGMADIAFDTNPRALSGGYKRRLALAVQLVRMPDLLLLDEPLAGLDWRARADVVKLLWGLKKECTLIVVSHDLKELTPLVDRAWHMEMGGVLKEQPWPPALSTD